MKSVELKRALEKELQHKHWTTSFDRDKDTFRVEDDRVGKGITIRLGNLKPKFEENETEALASTVKQIKEGMRLLIETADIRGNENRIYPVLRVPSFGEEKPLVRDEHTAETSVFYAVDEGASYSLIDEAMLENSGKTKEEIREQAYFNIRSLPSEMKQDEVAGNIFYFLHAGDGYEASRLLNDRLLRDLEKEIHGEMAVAVPHHDVFIAADIRNETGYDVLAQMTFQFFSEGHVPITALPFMYKEGELEPIFILAQKKPKSTKKDG
ncbi:DUF1444 family protein [Alkalicoccus urumqiensis]|uniref:DUF1444 domain-containing protein n=1 Tax=Alkalicoccus urumqiensis TaxID=1548213 RepID=A0A2P6MGJ1_ALKUR|nr:DUF1444 family protein [Alkalicoccus urumqiensis]PRO65399.1 DUF1444 domain-containing protein [Alkalicoccus urumqiensis]